MPTQSAPQNFIPHETAVASPALRRNRKGLTDLLALVSLVLFVASVALAVGLFLYKEFLGASAASKADQIERAKQAFEPSLIHELTRLDDRMRAAGEILQKHIAPSAFFRMLELSTINSVSFSSLNFEVTDAEHMAISMDGVAGSVNGIALQADLFSKGGMLTSPIFSNINRERDGVHFSLTASVDPKTVNFARFFEASAASLQAQPLESPSGVQDQKVDPGAFGVPQDESGI